MTHAVTHPSPPFLAAEGRLRVHQVPAAQDNLVWLIECVGSGEVAAVDGPWATEALEYCEAHGLRMQAILNTHTHGDHIGINRDLDQRGMLSSMRVSGYRGRADI